VRELGKTRGAIGFALIFLCFVSLYQDKEMKRKTNASRIPIESLGLRFACLLFRCADLRFEIIDLGLLIWDY
jgi:hypothetical protein